MLGKTFCEKFPPAPPSKTPNCCMKFQLRARVRLKEGLPVAGEYSALASKDAKAKKFKSFWEGAWGRVFLQKGRPLKALQGHQPLAIFFIFVYIGIPPFAFQYD